MTNPNPEDTAPLFNMLRGAAPVLVPFTQDRIVDELWHRPGLSARDRAIATVVTLMARNAQNAYPYYFNKALDSGVTSAEFSELVTHTAFYAGWPNAFAAAGVLKGIFDERGVAVEDLPTVEEARLPTEVAVPDDALRAAYIAAHIAPASEALQHFTNDLLYANLWHRPALEPRDRALATVALLAALGQSAFFPVYLTRALTQGVTRTEVGEMLAHTAFYGGWGYAIQAAEAAKSVFDAQDAGA
ncbi:carboxymuconolactone decarboxylase family protein [Asticcacaulis excentricus]|uniref:Carboxymuconolactone decarboxylase n=1 Tax=Asticcacaulis excentricus (strain ATCC 15261 / DSM 4724 / KCTC 12464 / NCIMB 9791 / VKM B-1370 / CB 48) TaxID=573065 RepID=E8RLI5_ASTEC|nr:carboxymuconolactone decarboxylase family protein [Asticcacaulis excentricus]ADU13729.1 Carboxymuconolactone decarboxylase [Asticcacaulis excentricus CB 48]